MKLVGGFFIDKGFEEVIFPAIWNEETFTAKAGPEIVGQMWTFLDKKQRACCLIPEVTALVQEKWKENQLPSRLFYVQKCYRYERPQAGRYREFTQLGIEIKNGKAEEASRLLKECLDLLKIDYEFTDKVKRGLNYYIEDGFEALCNKLGAQKQIAGGGTYAEGVGWAIGVDRVILGLTT